MKPAALLATLLAAAAAARAAPPPAPPPLAPSETLAPWVTGDVAVDQVEDVVEITGAEPGTRRLTLRDSSGRSVSVKVPPSITGFDRFKPGERVDARYLASAAVAISRRGQAAPPMLTSARVMPRQGAPQEAVAEVFTVSAVVRDLDRAGRRMTARTAGGADVALTVPPDMPGWDRVNAGDAVTVQYTDAVALSLEPRAR